MHIQVNASNGIAATEALERWAAAFNAEGIDPRLLATETGAA